MSTIGKNSINLKLSSGFTLSFRFFTGKVLTVENVLIYTGNRCKHCQAAKQYFKKQGIPYTELNVEQSGKARQKFLAMGCRAVPVILVGKHRLDGFDIKRFEKMYQKTRGKL